MKNTNTGVVEFKSGDNTYRLRFDVNVICDVEAELGEEFFTAVLAKGKATAVQMRKLFFLALRNAHPEIDDERKAGALLQYAQMVELMGLALDVSAPEPTGAENPPKPGQGGATGPASGSPGVPQDSNRTASGARRRVSSR